MRVIIAPDSFKGSLSASGVAEAIADELKAVFPDVEVDQVPLADGGEGTVEAFLRAVGGELVKKRVTGPLGEPVDAEYGLLSDGETAVIEMAAASGLVLVPNDKRDPRITTTYGTGELIQDAVMRGRRKLIIGIGGSATNDAGSGAMSAHGARFLDADDNELPAGGAALDRLARIDMSGFRFDPREVSVTVASDVTNPLCGPHGASHVFGPQKGATPDMVEQLDRSLGKFAEVVKRDVGADVLELPGAGAAGGLGAALAGFLGATLTSGINLILDYSRFDEKLKGADLVITGEGRIDSQTAYGKAVAGVAARAKAAGVPVVAFCGGLLIDPSELVPLGVAAVVPTVPRPMTVEEAMASAERNLRTTAACFANTLKLGLEL